MAKRLPEIWESIIDASVFKTTHNADGSTVRRCPALGLTEIRYPGGASYMRVRADRLGIVHEFWQNGRHFLKLPDGTWVDDDTRQIMNKAIVVLEDDGTVKIFQATGLEVRKPNGQIKFFRAK